MTKNDEKMYFPKVTLDDFFTTQEERDAQKLEKVQVIPIKSISNFPNHPFQVRDDEEMEEFVQNIKEKGVILPILVRPKTNGTYEMISGHRRKRACELAGITEIKAIIREMTDEEAVIQMVDSNKQREKILPSEKAFAYKMRLEAMKRQGQRNDLTSVPTAQKLEGKTSREILGEEVGESQDQVRRYIRLTELIPEILKLVDEGKMQLRPAVEISYLKKEEQDYLLESIEYTDSFPSHPQARQLKKLSQEGKLTEEEIDTIMGQEKANQKEKVSFKLEKIQDYFPPNYTTEKIEKTILNLLQSYKTHWQNKKKEYAR